MKLTAIVHKESGYYWAEIPLLPGCYTQAETLDELKANLKEAAECWLKAGRLKTQKEGQQTIEVEVAV